MPTSPLPDIRKLRVVALSILAGVYALLAIGFSLRAYDRLNFTDVIVSLGGTLSGMWILQWIVLAGAARPERRSSIGLIVLMALAFGCVDALQVAGWNMLALAAFGWIELNDSSDWMQFLIVAGFGFGVLLVAYLGWRLPRYEFLGLIFLLHLAGGACQTSMLFLSGEFGMMADFRALDSSSFTIWTGISFLGTVAVLWWGIAPITYLIAYRGYRQRLHLPLNEPPSEAKIG